MSQAGSELTNFLDKMKAGIGKTNLYTVTVPNKLTDLSFNAKGTQLPSSDLGTIELPYRGRKLKIPGQRTFAEWTITIMEASDMAVRKALEKWMNAIDDAEKGDLGPFGPNLVDIIVDLKKPDGKETAMKYTLYGAYPTNLASVDLSYDEQTAPLEYQATFNYSYHTAV